MGTATGYVMAKKKSEARKHTAMLRVDQAAHEKASLAASMLKMSLADYASGVLLQAAEKDIQREARKLVGGEGKGPKGGA